MRYDEYFSRVLGKKVLLFLIAVLVPASFVNAQCALQDDSTGWCYIKADCVDTSTGWSCPGCDAWVGAQVACPFSADCFISSGYDTCEGYVKAWCKENGVTIAEDRDDCCCEIDPLNKSASSNARCSGQGLLELEKDVSVATRLIR